MTSIQIKPDPARNNTTTHKPHATVSTNPDSTYTHSKTSTHKNTQETIKMQAFFSTRSGFEVPPYTTTEKQWLRAHWRSEYYFLLSYSLNTYDEGDREEGRRIARELIKAETMSY